MSQQPHRAVQVHRDVEMRTRDGVVLRCDVYRPSSRQKVPAILLRTPYDKSSARVANAVAGSIRPVAAVTAGFAFVVQDVRGRFASEGEYAPTISVHEGPDGYDTIEWLASEQWCNGRVGMIGGSYASMIQWLAAQENPPSLRAIVPERTGGASAGERGVMQFDSTMLAWAAGQAADFIRKRVAAGEAGAEDLDVVNEVFRQPQSAAWQLPLDELPFMRVPGLPSYAEQVEMFLRATAAIDASRISVPVLATSGWYDLLPGDVSTLFSDLRSRGGTAATREGSRVFFGPWGHNRLTTHVGERFFGNHASADGAKLPDQQLRFLSRWLRDDDVDIPVATYFVMGVDEWRQAEEWPPPGTQPTELFLSSAGAANSAAGDGRLVWEVLGEEPPDQFDYDPHRPVPSFGGRYYEIGGSLPGPFDQARIESRPDVLAYTSGIVEQPLEIAGMVSVRLFAASSAVDTDFVAKLCDVAPDGLSHNIADGIVRCRWRHGTDRTTLLAPGEVEELAIDLGAVAHMFLPGHRIRLQLTSSAFPAWDRNMNTGNPLGSDSLGTVATQTVYHGVAMPSAVVLPIQTARP